MLLSDAVIVLLEKLLPKVQESLRLVTQAFKTSRLLRQATTGNCPIVKASSDERSTSLDDRGSCQ